MGEHSPSRDSREARVLGPTGRNVKSVRPTGARLQKAFLLELRDCGINSEREKEAQEGCGQRHDIKVPDIL